MSHLMNTKEAAEYLRVHPQHVRNLANAGILSVYSPHPRRFFFKREWLDEYIEKNTTRAV